MNSIKEQCLQMGIKEKMIITSYVEKPLETRRIFLKNFAKLLEELDEEGECAEAGVFEGDFAKWINTYFNNKLLYLFDTFKGFDERDIKNEHGLSSAKKGDYDNKSIETIMKKMPYPEKCLIYKGYFPETAQNVKEKFCFVNLDMDLYKPTYNGLKFFFDKMTEHGIILVHDYFAENFREPKKAVDQFIKEYEGKISILPIGDGISVALSKISKF